MTFTVLIVALVQATEDNHIVGILSFPDGLSQQFVGAAALGYRTTYRDTIVALYRITHIATGIVYGSLLEASLNTIEWQYLTLYLQRRRATTYSHHLNSVLTHNEDALAALNRQHTAIVLQQHDTFLGNLQGCLVVTLRTEEAIGLLAVHRGTIEQAEHTAHLVVKFLRGILTLLDQLFVGIS